MEAKEKVLATMKEAGTPLNAGKIAELSGLDKKEVDKAMKQLKEEGAIVSPVRCKWAPAEWFFNNKGEYEKTAMSRVRCSGFFYPHLGVVFMNLE
mgnify:FL=1